MLQQKHINKKQAGKTLRIRINIGYKRQKYYQSTAPNGKIVFVLGTCKKTAAVLRFALN